MSDYEKARDEFVRGLSRTIDAQNTVARVIEDAEGIAAVREIDRLRGLEKSLKLELADALTLAETSLSGSQRAHQADKYALGVYREYYEAVESYSEGDRVSTEAVIEAWERVRRAKASAKKLRGGE